MTEEVTYANLKFGNSVELDNITEPRGPPTSPRSCWPLSLVLLLLCLLLLTALVTLAALHFQLHKDCRTQLRDLNITKHQLHANFSGMLQAIGNQLCLEGEKDLKNNGQKCVLCPANWQWKDGNTCYYLSVERKSWQESEKFCSLQNSTLLLIKETAKLELVKRFPRETYWVGLSFRAEQRGWYWADGMPLSQEQKAWTKSHNYLNYCPYFYYDAIESGQCRAEHYYICEKPALQLQRADPRQQQSWVVRPK